MRPFTLITAILAGAVLTAHAFEITEVLTENEGGLEDADGSTPGWIEIHNNAAAARSLEGWRLTDDPAQPARWTFPATTVAAGTRLVVFTSGKNRAVAGQELHTNFQIATQGEYLALVRPDGSIAQELNVPRLRRNVSWAVTTEAGVTPIITPGTAMRWRIPTAADTGSWTAQSFSDASWTAGTLGIGFDSIAADDLIRIDFNDRDNNTPANTETGFQPFVIGAVGGNAAVQTGPVTRTFGSVAVTLTNLGTEGYDDRLRATPTNTGTFTRQLLARDFIFSRDQTGNGGLECAIAGLPPSLPCNVTLWSFDSGSPGARISDWSVNGTLARDNYTFTGSSLPTANEPIQVSFDAVTDATGRLVIQGRRDAASNAFGVFLNAVAVGTASYGPHIATAATGMQGVNASLRLRAPFSLTDAASVRRLRLRARWDDGFAAWVNGTLLYSRNAPASPSWNAAATAERTRSQALTEEEITVDVPPGLLVDGSNVLAVQVLNASAADADLLFAPRIEALTDPAPRPRWYAQPTPGAPNAEAFLGIVADTKFSVDRGYHAAPFQTLITCATPGAVIRFTTDGSAPTASTGTALAGPLAISGNTTLRVAAFLPGHIPSEVDAQTYLFIPQVVAQPANPPGWPATWGTDAEVNANDGAGDGTVPADYAMDQRVVAETVPGRSVAEALTALPVVSLTMAPGDFLGSTGIYQNPRSIGAAWERPCSIEFFDPSGIEPDWQENCIVEVHGNSSRRPWRMQKHSLRLSFRGDVGASRLRRRIFPGSPVDNFDKLILRASFTDSWGLVSWDPGRYRPDDSVYFRDVWMKRAHAAMGELSTDSRWVHLYINGLYWGCHNLSERVEEEFVAAHMGGTERDYEVVDDFVDPDPSPTSRWKTLFNQISAPGSAAGQAVYESLAGFVDLAQFADYYLLHVFADCEDWPHHNGYAWRRRSGSDIRYRFGVWDQEIMLDNAAIDRLGPSAGNTGTDRTAGRLYQRLRENPEWRLLFADRVQRHLSAGGALSLAACQARWQQTADELDRAIVAESARWGDTADATPYGNTESRPGVPLKLFYTREADWLPSVASVRDAYLPAKFNASLNTSVFAKLRAAGLWPVTGAPVFTPAGGNVAAGTSLVVSATAGTIHCTFDGSDPREAWTGTPRVPALTGPVPLAGTVRVRARALNGSVWSPLTEALFTVGTPAGAATIAISRLHYNPPEGAGLEFIEVMNIAAGPVDLSGCAFTAGIAFTFPPGTLLAPGQRLIVVSDAVAFTAAWPAIPVAGTYTGRLDNAGEEIALTNPQGADIRRFVYGDAAPWPAAADGTGHSLTLIAPLTNPDHADPLNWRISVTAPVTPGSDDALTPPVDLSGDEDADGIPDIIEWSIGGPAPVIIAAPSGGFALRFARRLGADAVRLTVETGSDLTTWTPLPADALVETGLPDAGLQTETWTLPAAASGRQFVRIRAALRQP